MTNKELLERCAKVMGYELYQEDIFVSNGIAPLTIRTGANLKGIRSFNPLTSVADAADMAIKMKVDVAWYADRVSTCPSQKWGTKTAFFKDHPTEQAAYCYAVCSVVAQMGGE